MNHHLVQIFTKMHALSYLTEIKGIIHTSDVCFRIPYLTRPVEKFDSTYKRGVLPVTHLF